ncbi:hypothetical protein PpBr36_07754 [Pyricularia pennisetigena]|uniref:hypothetical protein n=1 Tax=Pyricularia pennisetigena TaxID=1578925 RepID=UPI00114E3890|nr:hypothetical protein PpBr36_07754 [Pyricularia pennisetigena]TLS25332.1 hypothetical protein PpBr36_07754 [Pyricularia pennisetigena]
MIGSTITKIKTDALSPVDEEKAFLLSDDKSLSDIESDAGRAQLESKFPPSSNAATSWLTAAGTFAGNNSSRPVSSKTVMARIALFLLPSFLPSRLSSLPPRDARRSSRAERVGPTAYLDGMRGVAAFAVFFCHYFYTCFRIAEGYGFGDKNYNILKLPFIRLWYQGPPMVCVFFVISGYALSLKPLKLARAAAAPRSSTSSPSPTEAFSTTMSSFIFRRFFRLFLPTAISTFLIVILLRIGAYEWTRDFAHNKEFMRNVQEMHPGRLETTSEQLWDWLRAMFEFIHVWDWQPFGGSTAYDVHLWTIPVEFRCSMVLFLTIAGVARLRTAVRLVVLLLLALFCYRSDRWDMLLFYSGTILAELDLIRNAHSDPTTNAAVALSPVSPELPSMSSSSPALLRSPTSNSPGFANHGRPRPLRRMLWSALSILALYFMSQPDVGSEDTPGWVFLTSCIPEWWSDKYRYWQTIGSILFVAAVGRLPFWQRVFSTSPAQYLGRISYSVYLMHGPVLHTVGYMIEARSWEAVSAAKEGGEARYIAGFVLGSFFIVPIVVWVADVFCRAVDAPVVKFSKWLEGACSVSSESGK